MGLLAVVAAEMGALAGASAVTQSAALFNLWRSRTDLGEYDYVIVGAGSSGCVLATG